jgi:hypothetical protein
MNEANLRVSGIFLPTQVLKHPALNPTMVYTWVLLRMLVNGQHESTPIDIQELEVYTGKSRSALYTHLTTLRRVELVRWHFVARGKLILYFPAGLDYENQEQETGIHSKKLDCSGKLDQKIGLQSRILEQAPSSSPENRNGGLGDDGTDPNTDFHFENLDQGTGINSKNLDCSGKLDQKIGLKSRILGNDPSSSPENRIETGDRSDIRPQIRLESRNLDGKPPPSPENWNDALSLKPLINNINNKEVLREARVQKIGPESENLEREAVRAYRSILGLRSNQSQRAAIGAQVQDLDLWQATLEHWGTHRWNPKNVPGILELYARDGPAGCRYCQQDSAETGLDALASLRREYAGGERG